jgi:hypothetical protein
MKSGATWRPTCGLTCGPSTVSHGVSLERGDAHNSVDSRQRVGGGRRQEQDGYLTDSLSDGFYPRRAVIRVEALFVPSAFGNSGLTKDSK